MLEGKHSVPHDKIGIWLLARSQVHAVNSAFLLAKCRAKYAAGPERTYHSARTCDTAMPQSVPAKGQDSCESRPLARTRPLGQQPRDIDLYNHEIEELEP